ncbi:molybdopterin-binding protein [Streptomyces sp. HPF1205]|uniref:TOBE domain-containing protein n=1 Tax=Streptomyces sp. HPF1205 TaxID=2873262 RepID=UPI001CEC286E|nr:TOBE domain-containing protein [Streptomyces sp. HPF1205]
MNNLSIRNRLSGTVESVTRGAVMAAVKTRLGGGQELVAAITLEAAQELGLTAGTPVTALVKSTEVALATAPVSGVTIRNQLAGTVEAIALGAVMASVKVSVAGAELTSVVTKEAVEDLMLTEGSPVVALVKSTEVSLEAI